MDKTTAWIFWAIFVIWLFLIFLVPDNTQSDEKQASIEQQETNLDRDLQESRGTEALSSDISANTQEYQQEFFQDDYSYIHSAAETGSILGTEDFAQQGFQQFAQEDVVDENGVIVSSGTKPGKSLGEYQTNISGEQMVGSRYIAARSYTIESDEKEIRGKKSKISGVQTRWIDAIREDVMTKGYGVGNLPYYGYVNYALADKSTMVFSKNGEKVVLKPLINVSMEIQDPKIEAGKDNLLSFRIEDDMKYIGEHVKVFFKPDRWEDEEIEIDCIRGKCTLPFVYKTTGEFVADVRMESAISSWLAQIEVVSNMSSISYQLVSHNTEYSNNVFQVLPNADFTVTETDGWDISFDGSVLEYDPYTHSYRNTESKTIVQVLEEGSSFDTKPVLRFEKRWEYEISHAAFSTSSLKWNQETIYHVGLVPWEESSFVGQIDGYGDIVRSQSQPKDGKYFVSFSLGQWTDDYYAELSFGDDSDAQVISSSSAEFTHEYVEPGIYPIEFFLKKNHDTIIDIQQYVFVSAENYPLSHIRYREKGTEEWVDVDPLDEMIFLRNIEYEFDASLSLGSEWDSDLEYHWLFSDTGKKFQTKKIHYGFYRLTTEERQDYFYLLVRDKNTEQTDLLKIFYQVPDIEPSVCFSVASDEGVSPFVVAFDALCSEDRDGKILSYRWDFGDGKKEVVEEAKIYHTYYYSSDADVTPYDTDFIARYNPILEIQDSEGNWFVSYDSVDLQVHKSSGVPKVFLNVPYAYDFIVGEELTVSLLASDIEEGYLRTGFSWYLQSQDKKIRYDIDQCRDYKKCTFTIPGAEVLQDYTDMLLYAQAQDTDGNIGISTPYPFVIHY